jgi:hypothetical protein
MATGSLRSLPVAGQIAQSGVFQPSGVRLFKHTVQRYDNSLALRTKTGEKPAGNGEGAILGGLENCLDNAARVLVA